MKYIKERDELFEMNNIFFYRRQGEVYLELYREAGYDITFELNNYTVTLIIDNDLRIDILDKEYFQDDTHEKLIEIISKPIFKKYMSSIKKAGFFVSTYDKTVFRNKELDIYMKFKKDSTIYSFIMTMDSYNKIKLANELTFIHGTELSIGRLDYEWDINSLRDLRSAISEIKNDSMLIRKFKKALYGGYELEEHFKMLLLMKKMPVELKEKATDFILKKLKEGITDYVKYLKNLVPKKEWEEKYRHLGRAGDYGMFK